MAYSAVLFHLQYWICVCVCFRVFFRNIRQIRYCRYCSVTMDLLSCLSIIQYLTLVLYLVSVVLMLFIVYSGGSIVPLFFSSTLCM